MLDNSLVNDLKEFAIIDTSQHLTAINDEY